MYMKKLLSIALMISMYGDIVSMNNDKSPADKETRKEIAKKLLAACYDDYEEAKYLVRRCPQAVNTYVRIYPNSSNRWSKMTPLLVCRNPHILEMLLKVKDANPLLVTKPDGNTGLHLINDKEIAHLLIRAGVSVHQKNKKGEPPLYCALMRKEEKYARYLAKRGASPDQCLGDECATPLLKAAMKEANKEMLRFLLAHGADPEQKDKFGATCFERAFHANKEVVRCFADHHYVIISAYGNNGEIGPHELLQHDGALFKQLLCTNKKAAVKAIAILSQLMTWYVPATSDMWRDYDGKIVFNKRGYYYNRVSQRLLEDFYGEETIEYVRDFLSFYYRTIMESIKAGDCDVSMELEKNPSLLTYDADLVFELLDHSMCNNMKRFQQLLTCKPRLDGTDAKGNNLLHQAVLRKNADAVKLLLQSGIAVNKCNNQQKTAFKLAVMNDCESIFYDLARKDFFEVLHDSYLHKGIAGIMYEKNFDINRVDAQGRTLLFDAIKKYPRKCSCLIQRGAEVNHTDEKGRTPLALAIKKCGSQLVLLLLDAGAQVTDEIIQSDLRGLHPYAYQKLMREYKRQHMLCQMCEKRGKDRVVRYCENDHYCIACRECSDECSWRLKHWPDDQKGSCSECCERCVSIDYIIPDELL